MASDSGLSMKRFVSEKELEEKRQKRQEEWEKVRRPDQPLECPEEKVDCRSLYDRLQEQKMMKQEEYEEQFKLKNAIKGLGEEDCNFLEYVSQRKEQLQRERDKEQENILKEMKEAAVCKITETKQAKQEEKKSLRAQIGTSQTKSQASLLTGAVKRKRNSPEKQVEKKLSLSTPPDSPEPQKPQQSSGHNSIARVIGVLPSVGDYSYSSDTSNTDTSSSSGESELEVECIPKVIKISTTNISANCASP